MAKKFNELLARLPESRQEAIRREADGLLQEMALAELRKARDMSQTQLAEKLGIKQPSVADMEKRTDMYVSTLRALIEGMGGQLDIIARFQDTDIRIRNFSEI
ncbi:MAG: XRE family transcriptional regulator [Desulfovibrio sp.]|nr:XRE family transcriptional regulator [Desulfovibrio sp.]